MDDLKVTLGKTDMRISKNGFGALPIQRIPEAEAVKLLLKAYDGGIRFFDTARFYTDSEQKIGRAFRASMRQQIYIASKTMALTVEGFWKDLESTLRNLQTDDLDLYQFHNPPFCPRPDDGNGLYEAMTEAVGRGIVRHIGITNHRLSVASEAIDSGLYATLQFPFNYLSGKQEQELVAKCAATETGFIAMKAMSGGLITNSAAAYAFLAQYDNVLPIWGIQRASELEEFLSYSTSPPAMTSALKAFIDRERTELQGDFCRGCGYCMPCPAGIEINNCARMSLLLRRSPAELQLTPEVRAKMLKIEDCTHCDNCISRCPYNLDTPALLRKNLEDYMGFN
ncbi:MAG: aldo/keto reductase [Tannerella sp.]|jgi:aryl-alcohol dehydrogenase-like predicted oxidoreductase|nr:aldo/keto reductase [Tannerella sp.]